MDIFHALLMSVKPNKQTVFSYEIDTTKARSSYRLSTVVPFVISPVTTSYPSDVTIDWGDGTTPTVIDYGTYKVHNTQPSHTYATAGVYTITITTESGCMPAWGWNGNSNHAPQLTKILTPFPTMYIFISGDVAVPYTFRYSSDIYQSQGIFFGCVNLSQLPTRLFKFNSQIISTYQMFRNCQSLASLPNDLGWYFTNIFNTFGMFYGCSSLTSITSPIFRNFYFFYSGSPILISQMFTDSRVQTITAPIFSNCKGIIDETNVGADICYGATNLINITVPMITGEISEITFDIQELFYNCYALNGDNLIAYSNLKTGYQLYGLYNGCRFTTVSNDFVTYAKANTDVTNVYGIFRGNTYLETVPDEVLAFPNAVNYSYAFDGCKKLQVNPNTFCLPDDKDTRFANAGAYTFAYAFQRTSFAGTQGTAPDLWNYTFGTTPTKTSCYKGAGNSLTSLTNYADIPTAWGGTA